MSENTKGTIIGDFSIKQLANDFEKECELFNIEYNSKNIVREILRKLFIDYWKTKPSLCVEIHEIFSMGLTCTADFIRSMIKWNTCYMICISSLITDESKKIIQDLNNTIYYYIRWLSIRTRLRIRTIFYYNNQYVANKIIKILNNNTNEIISIL